MNYKADEFKHRKVDELKHVHFRIDRKLWRHFRSLFPDKGDIQRVCSQALIEYIDRYEKEQQLKESTEVK